MAFTIEDGTGVAGANAYISVAEFKAYHDERGQAYAAVLATDGAIEQAIIRATDFVGLRWAGRFRGWVEHEAQELDFPRLGLRDSNGRLVLGIPTKLKQATAEYALRAGSGELLPDPSADTAGMVVQKTEKVGPIEESVRYSEGRPVAPIVAYPAADRLLAEYLKPTGKAVR